MLDSFGQTYPACAIARCKIFADVATLNAEPGIDPGSLRIGPLVHLPIVLMELGVTPASLLSSLGLQSNILDDPNREITYRMAGYLLRASVAQSGCKHVGLLVGARAKLDDLGDVGRLMRTASDLRIALTDLIDHQHLNGRGAITYLMPTSGVAMFGYAVTLRDAVAVDQIVDMVMALACNCVRELCGGSPSEILFARATPRDARHHRRHLPGKVRFDADQTALVLSTEFLTRPNSNADPAMRMIQMRNVEQLWVNRELSVRTRLVRLLLPQIFNRAPSAKTIAEHLAMHPRTLRRRLRDEGTGFREVLNETRFEISRQLLENTRLSITSIALALGCSEASAFSHAFLNWSGASPNEWRRKSAMD